MDSYSFKKGKVAALKCPICRVFFFFFNVNGMLDLQKKWYSYLHQDYRVLHCGKNAGEILKV